MTNASSTYELDNVYSMAIDDSNLVDCFIHLPDPAGAQFVLDYTTIANAQNQDAELVQLVESCLDVFIQQMLVPDLFVRCLSLSLMLLGKSIYQINYLKLQFNGIIKPSVM